MASYEQWNEAIAAYFTEDVPKGSGVFLSLDDDALSEISIIYLKAGISANTVHDDFVAAVRAKCVDSSRNSLNLAPLQHAIVEGHPAGLSFLAAMVLAAHRMAEDEDIDQKNYFRRLRQLVGLPDGWGRPEGMGSGAYEEEPLWIQWNLWLESNGWESTASRGPEGPHKYLRYPLSQALLRYCDKEYLDAKFREATRTGSLHGFMDRQQLAAWLHHSETGRKYLREGFRNADQRRAGAFYDAAYRIYESMDWSLGLKGIGDRTRLRLVEGGLYREVTLGGAVQYRLLPRQAAKVREEGLRLLVPEGALPLQRLRPGLYRPMGHQNPFVDAPLEYPIEGGALVQKLLFPKRDFWILTPDPEDPRGSYGTWEKYPDLLGQKFILLCRNEAEPLHHMLQSLRDEKLLGWDRDYVDQRGWIEYWGCMILSSGWDGMIPSDANRELYGALRPKLNAKIALSGGLRAPNQNAWLKGSPPVIRLYGFEKSFWLTVDSIDGRVMGLDLECQKDWPLDTALPAGTYRVEVKWYEQLVASKTFRIIEWDALEPSATDSFLANRVAGDQCDFIVQGAVVLADKGNGGWEGERG